MLRLRVRKSTFLLRLLNRDLEIQGRFVFLASGCALRSSCAEQTKDTTSITSSKIFALPPKKNTAVRVYCCPGHIFYGVCQQDHLFPPPTLWLPSRFLKEIHLQLFQLQIVAVSPGVVGRKASPLPTASISAGDLLWSTPGGNAGLVCQDGWGRRTSVWSQIFGGCSACLWDYPPGWSHPPSCAI